MGRERESTATAAVQTHTHELLNPDGESTDRSEGLRRDMAGLVNDRAYVPVNVDHEGYVESENALFKHVAIRDTERDSKYEPKAANVAPRPKGWTKSESSTHKKHHKIEALEALK